MLSVNATNRERAADWGVEVVAIPDVPGTLEGLDETIEFLDRERSRSGSIRSSSRSASASRRRWAVISRSAAGIPTAAIMMGVGNLTELTDVDSAGVNTLLIGFCQELGIGSVLTTAVINWARSSVREIDLARRLAHHAVTRRTLPKHVEPRLVDAPRPRGRRVRRGQLAELQRRIRDPNWRIFAEGGKIYALNNHHLLRDTDPVPALRTDGGHRPVARVLSRLRDDEGENRLDSEQDLSPGSSIRVGLPHGARGQPHREARPREHGEPAGRRGDGGRTDVRELRRGAGVILEGIVTTLSPDDLLNIAPMGPEVDPAARACSDSCSGRTGRRRPTPT